MVFAYFLLLAVALALIAGVYACHLTTDPLHVILTDVFGHPSRAPAFLRDPKNWTSYEGTIVPEIVLRRYPQINKNAATMLFSSRVEALHAFKGCIDDEVVIMLMKYIGEMQTRKACSFQIIGHDGINTNHNWSTEDTDGISPTDLIMAICAYKLALVPPAERVFAFVPKILVDLREGWAMPEGFSYASSDAPKKTAFERAVALFARVEDISSAGTVVNLVKVLERFAGALANGCICPTDEADLYTSRGWKNHAAGLRDEKKRRLIETGFSGKDLGKAIGVFMKTLQKPTLKIDGDMLLENFERLNLPDSVLAFCLAQREKDRKSKKRGDDAEAEMQDLLLLLFPDTKFNFKDGEGREFDAVFPDGHVVECKATLAGLRHAIAKQQAALVSDTNPCVAAFVAELGFYRIIRGSDGIARLGSEIDVSDVF